MLASVNQHRHITYPTFCPGVEGEMVLLFPVWRILSRNPRSTGSISAEANMPNRARSKASGAALARQQGARAQELAVAAFEFIAGEPRRLGRFLEMTGIAIESIREASRDSDFLAGVLDHICEDEPLLLAFCREIGVNPDAVVRARAVLSGAPWERDAP